MQNCTASGSTFILFSCLLIALLMCTIVALRAPAHAAPTAALNTSDNYALPSNYGRLRTATATSFTLPAIAGSSLGDTEINSLADASLASPATRQYHSVISISDAVIPADQTTNTFMSASVIPSGITHLIPEPSTIFLTLIGIAALRICRHRKA